MTARDQAERTQLLEAIVLFEKEKGPLPGIRTAERRDALIGQMVESIRRIDFVKVVAQRPLSPGRADPTSDLFDPIRAAMIHKVSGNTDEACWLVFLAIHFGKNKKSGWRLVRDVYGRFGGAERWDWASTSNDPEGFRSWLEECLSLLKGDGVHRAFGNHRKYQSLDARKPNGTGAAVASYVAWIGLRRRHADLIARCRVAAGDDPKAMFSWLYDSMDQVASFGRTAKFDYLTMLGKIGLAPIQPGSAYLDGATGPLSGGRLLFQGSKSATLSRRSLDILFRELDQYLSVGMQVLEDSLCNWQKSPDQFKAFRG